MELSAGQDAPSNAAMLPRAAAPPGQHTSTLETDELAGIVAALCAKFPGVPRSDVETLVKAAFEHLKAHATVTAHLIPLTLNRSVRLMSESTKRTNQDVGAVQCSVLNSRTG